MTARIRTFALTLLCWLVPPLAWPSPDLAIELDPSGHLMPTDVRFESIDDALVITGLMVKKTWHRDRIIGHAHIQILDADGRILAAREASLTHFQPSAKNPEQGTFETRIDPLPAGARTIRVQYDPGVRTDDAGSPP